MAAPDDFEPYYDDPPEPTDAELSRRIDAIEAEYGAHADAMTPAQRAAALSAEPDWDAVAEAALAPLPDFELTDQQCMDVAALLAPYAALDGEER